MSHGAGALAPTRRAAREILASAVAMEIGGVKVRTPAPGHALLLACAHGAHHRWDRFGWVADVAGLWLRLSPAEREDACAVARRWRMATMLGLGLRLAEEFMEIPLAGCAAELAAAAPVGELACRVELAAIGPDTPRVPMLERLRFENAAQDSPGRRLRTMAGWILTPTLGDIAAMPLPAALYPLYALIRPVRLWRHPWRGDWRRLVRRG